jgi:hypothetical protein
MRYTIHTLLFVFILSAISCKPKNKEKQVPVAKVFDKYLYFSEIKHIFPEKVSKQDSIEIASAYITTWVKNQLMLKQAELNLTEEQKDISEQVETYKSSILIYKYEDQMVRQKIDTAVSKQDIENYYNQNSANFILQENLVKAIYLKIPKTAPNIDDVKKWYQSNKTSDINKLDSYCYNYAVKYDFFSDDWVSFNQLENDLPKKIDNEDEFLKSNSFIEQEDDKFCYFISIKDKNLRGTLSPLEFVKTRIYDIIVNKRRMEYLNSLEINIFHDAQDRKTFEIYKLDK